MWSVLAPLLGAGVGAFAAANIAGGGWLSLLIGGGVGALLGTGLMHFLAPGTPKTADAPYGGPFPGAGRSPGMGEPVPSVEQLIERNDRAAKEAEVALVLAKAAEEKKAADAAAIKQAADIKQATLPKEAPAKPSVAPPSTLTTATRVPAAPPAPVSVAASPAVPYTGSLPAFQPATQQLFPVIGLDKKLYLMEDVGNAYPQAEHQAQLQYMQKRGPQDPVKENTVAFLTGSSKATYPDAQRTTGTWTKLHAVDERMAEKLRGYMLARKFSPSVRDSTGRGKDFYQGTGALTPIPLAAIQEMHAQLHTPAPPEPGRPLVPLPPKPPSTEAAQL